MNRDLIETDNPGFARDVRTRALLNTNRESLKGYKIKRAQRRSMQEEINTLKEDMAEIKGMLRKLIEEKE